MFGKVLGRVLSAPVRVANVAVKVTERVADEINCERHVPRKNTLDKVAEAIEDSAEEAIDG